ncbi:signal peptidase I [Candidatus Gottesmanbacteria bacterium]|nr:signal peptidase I [Candidatus Gottesmanbacteria bacterium]
MDKDNFAKVSVDSTIDKETPNVVVSSIPPATQIQGNTQDPNKPKTGLIQGFLHSITVFFMDFMETIVVALSIFVVVYLFLVQPHEVKGSSMEINFHNNEYILTDKISYRFVNPKRGDVIIFKAPNNPDVDYIKRVIGLPGDTVKVEKGFVFVNDRQLSEYYLKEKTFLYPGSFMLEGANITVPKDFLFVMGDNRTHSSDSREFGPIPEDSIIGKAFLRYWPITEFGLVPQINY